MKQLELPIELEDIIFYLAIDPEDLRELPFHLLLVSRRVYTRLKPELYRTVFVTRYRPNFHIQQNYALIENIVFVGRRFEQARKILPYCSGLKTIRTIDRLLYIPPYLHASTRVQRLSVSPFIIEYPDLAIPQLSQLTHLDLTNGPSIHELQVIDRAISCMKLLTHLSVDDSWGQKSMPMIDRILCNHQQLLVVILSRSSLGPAYSYNEKNTPSHATDVQKVDSRLVRLFCHTGQGIYAEEDWLAGLYHHRIDKWGLAEGLLQARKNEYYKKKETATGWIDSHGPVLVQLLKPIGCFNLAKGSILWAEHLELDWQWARTYERSCST